MLRRPVQSADSVDYQDDMQFEVTVDLIRIVLLP